MFCIRDILVRVRIRSFFIRGDKMPAQVVLLFTFWMCTLISFIDKKYKKVKIGFWWEDPDSYKIMTDPDPKHCSLAKCLKCVLHGQVLCNNPKKYAVVEPEGRISGQKCVDIVIRYVQYEVDNGT